MIIGIVGAIGSGKTLFMTRCAYKEYIKNKDRIANKELQIITNYKLKDIPFRYIKADEMFTLKSTLTNSRMFIDEMHIFMDSRNSQSKENKALTHFILQTRHLDTHLYFTTQDIGQVDIRLRRQLDLLVHTAKTAYEGLYKITIYDYRDMMNITMISKVYNGSNYYDLYDTKEIIDIT